MLEILIIARFPPPTVASDMGLSQRAADESKRNIFVGILWLTATNLRNHPTCLSSSGALYYRIQCMAHGREMNWMFKVVARSLQSAFQRLENLCNVNEL